MLINWWDSLFSPSQFWSLVFFSDGIVFAQVSGILHNLLHGLDVRKLRCILFVFLLIPRFSSLFLILGLVILHLLVESIDFNLQIFFQPEVL